MRNAPCRMSDSSHADLCHSFFLTCEGVYALLPLRVPHLDHVVVGAGDDEAAVVLHAPHGGHVADQHVEALPVHDVPHAQGRVARTGDHPGGGEGETRMK